MRYFSNTAARDKVLWCIVLIWAGLVFHHYFSLKTAFNLSFLSSVFSACSQASFDNLAGNWLLFFLHLSCALSISFVLWRIGRRFLDWLGLREPNVALRFCLEMAFGIILTNTLWLGLGLNLLWFESLQWLLGLGLLGWALWDFSRGFLRVQKFPQFPRPGRFFLLIGLLGLLGWALDILQGMTPDVYFDALVYHLSTLQFWAFHHGITDFYTNLYSYFPFGAELYFGDGFFFGGSEVAKLLNAFSAGLCGLAAAGWVAEEAGWDKGLLAWTMTLTLPLVSAVVWTTQNDVVLTYFLVLFLYVLVRWAQGAGKGPWALATGLLGGAVLTVKYTAVVSVLVVLLATVATFRKESLGLGKRKEWVWVVLLVAFSIAPWLLKNWAFTGNGFYPYLSSIFGGRALPAENMKALMNDHEAVWGGSVSPWGWISRVFGTELDKTIAPLLFSFLPFLFLGGKRRSLTLFFLALSFFLLLSGFLVSYQLRLVIPAFAVCFMAMALVLRDIEWKGVAMAWGGIVTVFAVLSLLSLGRLSVDYYRTEQVWLGAEGWPDYLNKAPQSRSYFWMARAAGRFIPTDQQLLVVGDARGLYYPCPFLTNSVFDEQVFTRLARTEKDGDGIRKKLKEMGIDAIVVSGDEGKRLSVQSAFYRLDAAAEGKWGEFLQRWTDPLFWGRNSCLYRVRSTPAGPRPLVPDFFKVFQDRGPTQGKI